MYAAEAAHAAIGQLLNHHVLAQTHHAAQGARQAGGVHEVTVGRGLLVDAARDEGVLRGEGLLQGGDSLALASCAHSKLGFVDPDRGSH
jgi:hypothetical protein